MWSESEITPHSYKNGLIQNEEGEGDRVMNEEVLRAVALMWDYILNKKPAFAGMFL